MTTLIVNISSGDPYDVYIGRAGNGHNGYWGNPFKANGRKCKRCGQAHWRRSATLPCYQQYFQTAIERSARFKRRLEELRGKTLGCFCRPPEGFQGRLMCHGQVIAGYLDGIPPEQVP